MSASFGAATSESRPELIHATYRRLRQLGFDDPVAANLTAFGSGFLIGTQPWKVRELTHLLFLRELASTRGEWTGAQDRALTNVDDGLAGAPTGAALPGSERRPDHPADALPGRGRLGGNPGSARTEGPTPPMASPEPRREGG